MNLATSEFYTCTYCSGTGGRASCPIHGDHAHGTVRIYGPGFDETIPYGTPPAPHACGLPCGPASGIVSARPDWTCGECGRIWRWWNGGGSGALFWWVEVQGPASVHFGSPIPDTPTETD